MNRVAISVLSLLLLGSAGSAALGQPNDPNLNGGLEERPPRPTDPKDFTAGMMAGPYDATVVDSVDLKTTKESVRIVSTNPTSASLVVRGLSFKMTRVTDTPDFEGTATGNSIVNVLGGVKAGKRRIVLTIVQLNKLVGTIEHEDGTEEAQIILWRSSLAPLSAAEKAQFDAGPPQAVQDHLDALKAYDKYQKHFWSNFGPVFYRGRTDGSARILGIASDPGPTECLPIVRRTLVGDAGQRVQGFLRKVGLTRSYVLANAHAYALFPSHATAAVTTAEFTQLDPAFVADLKKKYAAPTWGQAVMNDPEILAWRNKLYSSITSKKLQAVVIFGNQGKDAFRLWAKSETTKAIKDRFGKLVTTRVALLPDGRELPVFYVQHPSAYDPNLLLATWRSAIPKLRRFVTPDDDAPNPLEANYGEEFTENDYQRIPRGDLPKDSPTFIGDDSWGRAQRYPQMNAADRPQPDDRKTLIFESPSKLKIAEKLYTVTGPDPVNPNRTPLFAVSEATLIDVAALAVPATAKKGAKLTLQLTGKGTFDRVLVRTSADGKLIRVDAYVKSGAAVPNATPWTTSVTLPAMKTAGTYTISVNGAVSSTSTKAYSVVVPEKNNTLPIP